MNKQKDVQLWLSIATLPCLLGYLGMRTIAQTLQEIGQNSEEIFRGDRLPLLHFPAPGAEEE